MNKYTIYCTEEQTKKALDLGAPIKNAIGKTDMVNEKYFFDGKGNVIIQPTAEEIIGWLEEQEGLIFNIQIYRSANNTWAFNVYTSLGWNSIFKNSFSSRKAVTLAAIDVALEYLSSKIKE